MSDVSHLNSKEDIRMLSLSQSVKEEREIVVVVKRLQRDLYSSTVFAARVTRVNTEQCLITINNGLNTILVHY